MSTLSNLIRPDLQKFNAYSASKDEAAKGSILLNANELPYATNCAEGFPLNRYPEKQPRELIKHLADLYNVDATQILLGRGSDELIDLLVRLFCQANQDAILICPPTFGMYAVSAQLQGANVIEVPLQKEQHFQLNLAAIKKSWQDNVKIIFLCSPNNPTGNVIDTTAVLQLCQTYLDKSVIVVDEAYVEFAKTKSFSQYLNQFPNLVILRTFSKAYGLAGIRCGAMLAQQELVWWMKKIIAPYPLTIHTSKLVLKMLQPAMLEIIQQRIVTLNTEKNNLMQQLVQLSCVKNIWPSDANFLLVEMTHAKEIFACCNANGIILRDMSSKPGLENCLRISIGLPDENKKLLKLLQQAT